MVLVLDMHEGPRKRRKPPWRWVAVIAAVAVIAMTGVYVGFIRPLLSHSAQGTRPALTAPLPPANPGTAATSFGKCIGIAGGSGTANVPLSAIEMEIRFALRDHCGFRIDFEMRAEMPSPLPQTAYWMPSPPNLNPAQQAILNYIGRLDRGRPAADQLQVIGIPDNVPGWANPELGNQCNSGPVLCAPDAAHVDAYGQFGGDVAYSLHQVTANVAIEPGNEVNSAFSFQPAPSPKLYVGMLRSITKYVNLLPKYAKFVHTPTQVIFSGLSPAQNPGISPLTGREFSFIDPVTFVTQAYASGAKPYFTAMGMHVGMNGLSQVLGIRQVMVNNRDSAKPVVLTELDISASSMRVVPGSADYVSSLLAEWRSLPWMKSVLIYAPPADGADNSLYTTNMKPKTAMQAVVNGGPW